MSKIKIIIDSAATLTEDIIKSNNIGVVYLKVIWPEENINGHIKGRDLFQKMREAKVNTGPKTSQPSVGDFKKAFEEALKTHDEVVCITISTGLSGTYNSAIQAIKFLSQDKQDKIAVIDSLNVDGGEGLLALEVVKLVQKGLSADEIASTLEEIKKNVFIVGFFGDPEWIERNGRLSKTGANLVRRVEKIGIRPLLTLKDGKIKVTSLKFKAKDKAESLLKELKDKIGDKKTILTITHADMINVAEELKKKIEKDCPNIKVLFIDEMNPIIGCHLGPDSIVCCYYLN